MTFVLVSEGLMKAILRRLFEPIQPSYNGSISYAVSIWTSDTYSAGKPVHDLNGRQSTKLVQVRP